MQQCDSPYVVKYYGSYFKNTDLWVTYLSIFKHILEHLATMYKPKVNKDINLCVRIPQGSSTV